MKNNCLKLLKTPGFVLDWITEMVVVKQSQTIFDACTQRYKTESPLVVRQGIFEWSFVKLCTSVRRDGLNMIWASLYVLPKLSGKLSLSIFAAKKSFNFLKNLKYCKLPLIRPGLRGFNRAYKRRGLYRRELMAGIGKALWNIVLFTGKWAFNFRGVGGSAACKRQITVCAK